MSAVMHEEDWIARHRITVDEYYRMAEVGLLAPEARVELIDGVIIDKAPIGSRHAGTVTRFDRLLLRAVGDQAIVRVQQPVRLSRSSEPQPDVSLLRPRPEDYTRAHPRPEDALLVVEVSDTTLRYDREVKVPLYARHGIPELWIVDLVGGQMHFFRSPQAGKYSDVSSTEEPSVVRLATLSDATVDLSGILSP